MKLVRLGVLAGALALCGVAAHGGGADVARLVGELRRGRAEAKARLVEAGAEAVEPLFALLADADAQVGWEARSALRWIAVRAAERGAPAGARERVVAAVAPHLDKARPPLARRVALELLGLVGGEPQVAAIAPLLGDAAFGEDAALALSQIWGQAAKGALLDALGTAPAARKARILGLIASHGEANTLPAFVAAAKDADEAVRVAAVRAMGLLGVADGAEPLLEAVRTGSPRVKAAAFDAYLSVAAAVLRGGDAPAARVHYERALGLAQTDEQRAAALLGIGQAGQPESLAVLTPHLKAASPRVRTAAHTALCGLRGPAGTRAVAAAFGAAPAALKPMLLRALGERGDRAYTELFVEAAADADELAALAALRALRGLGDPAVAPRLAALAKHAKSPAVRAVALDAAVRLGHELADGGQAAAALAIFQKTLPLAGTDAERTEILRGLAKTGRPEAAALLLPIARDKAAPLRALAAEALAGLADTAAGAGRRDQAIAAYKQIVDLEPADPLLSEATAKLRALGVVYSLAIRKGFITSWWVIGPFPCPRFAAAAKPQFPEREIELAKTYKAKGQELRWRLHHSGHPKGWVDLNPLFHPNDKVLAYAYTEVTVGQDLDVALWLRRDDGLTVWLNGKVLYAEHGPHSAEAEEFRVDARLAKGVNRLLVKCSEGSGDWQFAVRLTDRAGKPFGAP